MARRRSSSGIGGAIGIGVLLLIGFVAQYWIYIAVVAGVALAVWLVSVGLSAAAKKPSNDGTADAATTGSSVAAKATTSAGTTGMAFRAAATALDVAAVTSTNGDDFWVPADKTARFNERPIGSFIYVGHGLAAAGGQGIEPALLDATLPVDLSTTDCTERRTPYWPTYASISAQARAALLNWLASGRSDPKADIGYVFLYFYGLERRALHDTNTSAAARQELPAIEREVQRLLSIYSTNRSIQGYATQFLDLLSARNDNQRLYISGPPPVQRGALTFRHRLGLAQCAADGAPLPAPWALTWLYGDWNTRLRTPATRCRDLFERLFATRYRAAFGAGLVLPRNRTRLTFDYRPASSGFHWGAGELKRRFDLPDVSVLTAPLTQLRRLAEDCTEELGAYSRIVGKDAAKAATFDGMLELPVTLWPESVRRPVERVKALLTQSGRPATLPFATLRSWFPEWTSVSKAKMQSLARALAQAGVGIEPDARFGGLVPDGTDKVVLFADEGEQMQHTSARYAAAAVMLRLAVSVAAADGAATEDEQGLLAQQLEKWLHLNEAERRRLNAYLKLLIAQPPGAAGLKKAIEPLDMHTRESMAEFLALLAQVDGTVSAAEVKVLEKLFKVLGLEAGTVYSKVHAAATEPISVRPTRPEVVHPIPQRPAAKPAVAVQLDPAKVAALQADSERVAALLGAIFAGEPEPAAEAVEEGPAETAASILGLDASLSAFARTLLERSEWARTELEELATDRGIMLDGSLEHINEAALDAHDAPLLEGTDPVALNPDVVKELAHEHQVA